jgi:uncharacterized membrane protein
MKRRLTTAQYIEVALLAPATFALLPALPLGIVFAGFAFLSAVALGLFGGNGGFLKAIRSSADVAALFLMMLAAGVSLISLWVSVLRGPEWVLEKVRRKRLIVVSLLAGWIAVGYWFSRLGVLPHDAGERKALLFWILLLIGPVLVALRQLWLLLGPPHEVHRP